MQANFQAKFSTGNFASETIAVSSLRSLGNLLKQIPPQGAKFFCRKILRKLKLAKICIRKFYAAQNFCRNFATRKFSAENLRSRHIFGLTEILSRALVFFASRKIQPLRGWARTRAPPPKTATEQLTVARAFLTDPRIFRFAKNPAASRLDSDR